MKCCGSVLMNAIAVLASTNKKILYTKIQQKVLYSCSDLRTKKISFWMGGLKDANRNEFLVCKG